ncbi:RNase P modulator RnpM [Macrococcus lamae]|uniref:YlxR family protein n=1 Tax=Macrococcus lamae TaxID=198484 RepID=A0A4R6BUC5_9STAP|nr:YlxR family protein [Macrococcus lamae]TDM11883.1 YlxR family protein [Macrococcus lamae]
MKQKKIPMRKCILSQEMKPKKEMIRVVRSKEGEMSVDPSGKANGRGAYVSKNLELVESARQKKRLEQFFDSNPDEMSPIYDEIIRLIYREMIPKR